MDQLESLLREQDAEIAQRHAIWTVEDPCAHVTDTPHAASQEDLGDAIQARNRPLKRTNVVGDSISWRPPRHRS
jgi:hypothetical protein